MKPLPAIAAALFSVTFAFAETSPADLSAQDLLDGVVARLPKDPLLIRGDLTVRKRRGVVLHKLAFEMAVSWGSEPAVVRYTIRDAFGTDLEQLIIRRSAGRDVELEFATGDPLTAAKTPGLFEPIQTTDITWNDLSLSFLWWPGGSILGSDEVKGRPCHVLEVPAPVRNAGVIAGQTTAACRYAKVRLWIDRKLSVLLQAEGMNANDVPIRRMWVKSFKKIDDRWMIKDMEIQSVPPVHRTKLRIKEVSAGSLLEAGHRVPG